MSSTERSRFAMSLLAIGLSATSWTVYAGPWQTDASPVSSRHESFGGVWSLNREASQMSDRGNPPPRGTNGQPGRSGGGRGGGGRQGRRGFGGRGDGGNPEQMQAMANYMRSLMEPSGRLTIVVQQTSVKFTEADGRTVTLQTNNKSADERAENGLLKLKRKSKWDGAVLVSEIEIENGPTSERRYELFRDGEQLRVSTTMNGGFGGRGGRGVPPVLHVYDRERPQ